ncbi:serine hydrolase domain-containing protein [Gandjariella thermophila]|uniref:serine hydrolase domain-containing protein n=1 Tax=Gandjariella thermophila TaxID=1931992 RepID=UPI003531218F
MTVLLAVLTALADPADAEVPPVPPHGRFDQPYRGFAPPSTLLRDGSPAEAGLDPGPIDDALRRVRSWTEPDPGTGHPMFSGAVTLLAHDGVVVARRASGYALRYADAAGTELAEDRRIPMRTGTVFDLASLSKLFTSIVALQQIEAGRIELTAPVARYLPEFATSGKGAITVEQLLTHTSGLEPDLPLWRDWPDIPSRFKAVLDVAPVNPPGSTYLYSDLNMIALQLLVQQVTGRRLDLLVRDGITGPLGMAHTGYNPPPSARASIAATEFESDPPRGLVWGEVHDENAWALGGVAGHAGVFSTADDLAVLGQALLDGGSYAGHRILRPDTVREMLTDYNGAFPGDAHGLGFELDQRWYMGALTGPRTAGHTGFTGTTLVIDPASRSIAILLTNRVHPNRNWGSINPARRAVADGLARSLAVRPRRGPDAWASIIGDTTTNGASATLTTVPLAPRGDRLTVSFDAFVDADPADQLLLESSSDGVSWRAVPVRANGCGAPGGEVNALTGYGDRCWWTVRAKLPASGPLRLRWRYTAGDEYAGRGVYLDAIRVGDAAGTLLDAERDRDALTASGWRLATR